MLPFGTLAGTGATMDVSLQDVGVASQPLNTSVLAPCVAPKFVPVIVTEVPTPPLVGDSEVMTGTTVYVIPFDDNEPQISTTCPVDAPDGTNTSMPLLLHELTVICAPPRVTVQLPCTLPK